MAAGCASAQIAIVGSLDAAVQTLHKNPGATVYLLLPKGEGRKRRVFATLAEANAYFNSESFPDDWVWVVQGDSVEQVSRGGAASGSLALGDRVPRSAGLPGIRLQPAQQTALCEDIIKIVQLAPRLWPGYELAGQGIMVNTGEEAYAFGFHEAILRQVFPTSGLNTQAVSPVACGGMPFFRLAASIETANPIFFVFGRSDRGDPRLGELAGLHGHAFLYVKMRAFDPGQRAELRRTIVHEGAHLFLQGAAALQNEPEFCLANQPSTCGRTALEALYRDDPAFRRSVHEELCAARRLDETGGQLESRARPEDAARLREDLAVQLNLMMNERQRRGERYGTTEIEEFWYALEGVPSYLEEAAEREAGAPHGFSHYLPESCEPDPPVSYFYPLSCGGILWYTVDLLEGAGRWKSPVAFLSGGYRELFINLRRDINGN